MIFMRVVFVLVVLAAAGALSFTYWSHPFTSRDSGSPAKSGDSAGSPPSPALGQFTPLDPPRPAPELSFAARDGSPLRLADFRGRWVLVNLWATWCAPCVREMPSLDRLQAKLGKRLAILAISEDRGGANVVDPFLQKLALQALGIYLDPKGRVGQELEVRGLPTSVLVDGEGRLRARLEGAADWDSPEMLAKLERYLRLPDGTGIIKTSAGRS